MIIKNEADFGASIKDKKFFIDNYDKIKPVKKITVFFDCENFLLTDYYADIGTTFIAEGWNGNEMHLTGLNCGYGGEGPSRMADILCFMGMDREEAEQLRYKPGLQIEYDKLGNIEKISDDLFFSSQLFPCKVHLCENIVVDYEARKAYFINPQYRYINDVFNIIDKIKPTEFQYFIGKDSPLEFGVLPMLEYNIKESKAKRVSGVNLILKGQKLDVMFLIDSSVSRSFVNVIYSYLTGEALFDDNDFISKPKHGVISYVLPLFKCFRHTDLQDTIRIDYKGE